MHTQHNRETNSQERINMNITVRVNPFTGRVIYCQRAKSLREANLDWTNFTGVDLHWANRKCANRKWAYLTRVYLTKAYFDGAKDVRCTN